MRKTVFLLTFICILSSCSFVSSSLNSSSALSSSSSDSISLDSENSTSSESSSSELNNSSSSIVIDPSILASTDLLELDRWFSYKKFIPEEITTSIPLPEILPGFYSNIEWTITSGDYFVEIKNNLLTKKFPRVPSGVIEIVANIPEVNYKYKYQSYVNGSEYTEVPVFYIETENEQFPTDKENYVMGEASIVDINNEENKFQLKSSKLGIKLRGNSTLGAAKKAFRLKFDKKQSLFNLPSAKSWVLLANYFDKSNLRNYLAYTLARSMENLDFQPSSIFVDVVINGVYHGLYLLCEQMQSGVGRADVEEEYDNEGNCGYFIEMDARVIEEGGIYYKDYFTLENLNGHQRIYAFKYPDPEEGITEKQVQFIYNYFYKTDYAIKHDASYSKYINVDSFIDYYIVQELFKNVDVASTSQYYIKKANDKLEMGPVWDFDIALGVMGTDAYRYYNNIDLWVAARDGWYNYLLKTSFKDKVKERYTQIRETYIADVLNNCKTMQSKIYSAQQKNLTAWPIDYLGGSWIEERYSYEYTQCKTLSQIYAYLENQIKDRMRIMDAEYLIK